MLYPSCYVTVATFVAVNIILSFMLCCCSHCDVNSPRRPGPNGEGEEEVRLVSWSMSSIGVLIV